MAYEDLRPSKILTREAFLNAIRREHRDRRVDQRPAAHRRHGAPCRGGDRAGDWMEHGYDCRCSSTCSRPGKYLSERFHRAGGVPAVMWELLQAGKLDGGALTVHRAGRRPRISQGRESDRPRGDLPLCSAAEGTRRLPRPERQSVRLRDHEDQRDLGRISRALSVAAGRRRRVRGARDRVRRLATIITTGSTIPRSGSTRIASS